MNIICCLLNYRPNMTKVLYQKEQHLAICEGLQKKSQNIMSDDLGGHTTGPHLQVQGFRNLVL